MKIPSQEFWYKIGLCTGAAIELEKPIKQNMSGEPIFKAQVERIEFMIKTLAEIAESAYEVEDED